MVPFVGDELLILRLLLPMNKPSLDLWRRRFVYFEYSSSSKASPFFEALSLCSDSLGPTIGLPSQAYQIDRLSTKEALPVAVLEYMSSRSECIFTDILDEPHSTMAICDCAA